MIWYAWLCLAILELLGVSDGLRWIFGLMCLGLAYDTGTVSAVPDVGRTEANFLYIFATLLPVWSCQLQVGKGLVGIVFRLHVLDQGSEILEVPVRTSIGAYSYEACSLDPRTMPRRTSASS